MTQPFAGKVRIADAALEPWPLPPGSIVAGSPQTSGLVLSQSADACIVRGIWACTPGSFTWHWAYDETLVVVSGRASVHLEGGRTIELKAGDLAFFERGQSATWVTHEMFRKGFHAHSPEPLPF